jgi:thymidylate kinase
VVIDVSFETAARRRSSRSGRPELYDDPDVQTRLVAFYRELEKHFPNERIAHVDGERDADAVHRDVLAQVDALRALG